MTGLNRIMWITSIVCMCSHWLWWLVFTQTTWAWDYSTSTCVHPFTRLSFPMGRVHRGSRDETIKTIQWPDTPLVGIQAGAPLTPQVVGLLIPIHESCHEDYFGRVNSLCSSTYWCSFRTSRIKNTSKQVVSYWPAVVVSTIACPRVAGDAWKGER